MAGAASAELLVVGAGPAGLTAAWRAARAGFDVVVVDRADRVGGMAASLEVAGQRVDLGSHRLHPAAPLHVLGAVRELLGEDLQLRRRNGRIRLRDRWLAFPLRAPDLARNLDRGTASRLVRDVATRPLRRTADDTFAEVVRSRLGPTALAELYGPYARKIWDAPPDELEGELARRRIAADGPAALTRRLVARAPGPGRTFWYPRLGYGQIPEALADAATDAGVRFRLGSAVTGLELQPGGVEVALGDQRLAAGHVLWSGPIGGLVRAVRPGPGRDVRDRISRLRFRAVVLVYLVVDRPRYTEFDAHHLPDPGLAVARLSEPKNYRDGPDPADRTVLCAELPCWVGDTTWRAEPDELGLLVADALVAAGLPDPAPVAVEVVRLPNVYPVYRLGFRRTVDEALAWADGLDRVTLTGRQGTFVADNLHHVMAMGWDAADAMRPGPRRDDVAWRAARRRHAEHVVED